MKAVNTQLTYILHKRAYRETSSILELFTQDYGRISLLAKGCRGKKSKTSGNLRLFTPLLISWQGRGNLPYLTSVEPLQQQAPQLKNKSILCAMYLNELIVYLTHKDDAQTELFNQYQQCLYHLEDKTQLEISLRKFEISLLQLLGFGLNFAHEANTGAIINPQQRYYYQIEHGVVLATTTKTQQTISGACLLALENLQYQQITQNPVYLQELKLLMRKIINYYIGNKKLKSREMFKPI